jgi:hypothetical protein
VRPAPPAPATIDPGGRPVGYAPFYYPGTPILAQAASITLNEAQELSGIDISLRLVPVAAVEGMVTSHDGQPITGLQVSTAPVGQVPALGLSTPSARTMPDGKFTLWNVPPGRYTIVARARTAGEADRAAAAAAAARLEAMRAGGPPAPPPPPQPYQPPTLWAMEEIDVAGVNISSLSLQLRPGMAVSGRLAYDAKTLKPPADLTQVRVVLSPVSSGPMAFSPGPSRVDDTGKFVIDGLGPGRYRLSAISPFPLQPGLQPGEFPTTWMVKTATIDGRDVLDTPIEIRANENVEGVVITFSDQYTELSGTLLDAAGIPVIGYYVAIFPTERTLWSTTSRRMRTFLAQEGKYRLAGLPPGEYYLAVLTEVDTSVWGDPEFMELVAAGAIKITLAEAEKKTQDMKIGR